MVTLETKLIALTNPNNPTGALIERPMLEAMLRLPTRSGLIYSVTRFTEGPGCRRRDGPPLLISTIEASAQRHVGILPRRLRVGWVVAPKELTEKIMIHRDYDTISVGMINDHFAATALENASKVLARSQHTRKSRDFGGWVDTSHASIGSNRARVPLLC